jgi:hypothetical protein
VKELKELWQRCFDDSDEFVDMYFRLCCSHRTAMYIRSGGAIVSSLQMPCYTMTFEGTGIPVAYIAGACTHPGFRGRGLMARLLVESLNRMVRENILLSVLIPAGSGLADYYAKAGFAYAFFRSPARQSVLPAEQGTSAVAVGEGVLHVEYTTVLEPAVANYFIEKTRCRPNYIQHTIADLEAVVADLRMSGGSVSVARSAGRIVGVLFAYPDGGVLKITEWLADDDSLRNRLIDSAARHYRQPEAVWFELPVRSVGEQAFGMARIINAKAILSLYAAAHPREQAAIHLTDEQLALNNGYYYISNGACTFIPEAAEGKDLELKGKHSNVAEGKHLELKGKHSNVAEGKHLELTTHELSVMIFDRIRPYMSLMLE